MATEKQNAANKLNAQKSTGPSTPSGKEASARNALKHGLSAKKYLTSSETIEEFAALYAARRRHYPPDDPIIDRLIEKITLVHFRIGRGFEAEGEILSQGSLAEMLVHYEKPVKSLGAYEASNRKTLKMLEEELARYLSMLRETGDLEPMTAGPTVSSSEEKDVTTPRPPANDTATPSTPAVETPPKDTKHKGKPKPATGSDAPATATKPVAAPPAEAVRRRRRSRIRKRTQFLPEAVSQCLTRLAQLESLQARRPSQPPRPCRADSRYHYRQFHRYQSRSFRPISI